MLYRFADCVLDTQLYTLARAGSAGTRLAPKVFEVLCYLIAHRGRVVSKQELCDQVWEGLAISDAAMESCLRAVRLDGGGQRAGATHYPDAARARLSLCGGHCPAAGGHAPSASPAGGPAPSLAHPPRCSPASAPARPASALIRRPPRFVRHAGHACANPVPTVARRWASQRRSAQPVGSLSASHLLPGAVASLASSHAGAGWHARLLTSEQRRGGAQAGHGPVLHRGQPRRLGARASISIPCTT